MSLLRWDPREDLMTMRDEMMRLMDEGMMMPQRMLRRFRPEGMAYLLLDAYETDEEVVILASVPGLSPDDVEITFEGDTLTIKGEIKDEETSSEEERNYIFRERPRGTFRRSLVVNVPVDADQAEAGFENGMLTLTLPKSEEVRPKVIKVKTE